MILEILTNIAAGFVELVIRLLALVLRSSYLASFTKGISRFAHILVVVLGAYLLFGIGRAFFDALATPALQPAFAWPIVVTAIVLLLIAVAVPEAAREIAMPERKSARQEEPAMLWPLALVLSFAIILGGLSLWSGEKHRQSLAERACDAANARINPEWRNGASEGLALADRLLQRETATRLPCSG